MSRPTTRFRRVAFRLLEAMGLDQETQRSTLLGGEEEQRAVESNSGSRQSEMSKANGCF